MEILNEDLHQYRPWISAEVGDPVLVHTREEKPLYWNFPVIGEDVVLGFIHVAIYGRINKWGTFYDDPEDISMCPKRYPRISGKDAREKARDRLSKYKEVKLSEPIYVYTEGKEAWMLLIRKENKIVSRVFATNRFIWEETQPPSPFLLK